MKRKTNLPRITGRLVQMMFPEGGKCSVLGDMNESYRDIAENKGTFRARLWFWGQCFKALPYFLLDIVYWRISMFKNYLLITVRNLKKNSLHSMLNIVGLAVGLAAFLLIALYVQHELSFDRHFTNADRIFRVVREDRAFTPAALAPAAVEKFPEITVAARILRSRDTLVSYGQKHFQEEKFYWADPEFFEVFSIFFLYGDPKTVLLDPDAILLSASTAKKYFGSGDPMGKTLVVSDAHQFKVAGVFKDMPANSHMIMDVIVPYKRYFQITGNDITSWRSNFSYTYVLLQSGTNPEELESKFAPILEKPLFIKAGMQEPYPKIYSIQPVTEIHLYSHRMQEIPGNNDIKYIILFSSVALLILFIACINYMNLATARSLRRGREVGMRKVVGAQRKQLIFQFLGESVAVTVLAMSLAIFMLLLLLPVFNSLVERQLQLDLLNNPQLGLGLVGITLLVGILSGSYPAVRISAFRPIAVLGRSFFRKGKRSSMRNILVLVQFSITIFLIICTLTVKGQLDFIKKVDMGYAREQIITIPVRDRAVRRNIDSLKTELLGHPEVIAVATSGRLPNDIDTFTARDWTGRNQDDPIPIFYNTADYDFVDLFAMEIVQGRNFSQDFPSDEKGVFLVNEAAVSVAGWEEPMEQELTHWKGNKGRIIGVIKDFHLHSLHRPIDPLYIFLDKRDFLYLSIKIKAVDIPAALGHTAEVMQRFSPNYPFSYSFFDEVFARSYFTEQKMGNIFGYFAGLAIFIAGLGLFGLVAFAAEQRTKEIGIRKVLGASMTKILFLLSREFMRWVLLANIIAWPVAYLIMHKWLQNFAYRINIGIVIFLVSGGTALFIAFLTVGLQALKSAAADPVAALRYE